MNQTLILGVVATTLALSAPLLLAALGELIGERAGVLNIGLEGMMLGGAWGGAAASFAFHSAAWGVVGAMLGGVFLAAIFALVAIIGRADAIVTGTGLNLLAIGATGVAHRAMIARFGSYEATTLPQPIFWMAGAVLVPLLAWMFGATRFGLQLRAVGEYPVAADAAGVDVVKMRVQSTLMCGALCGLAGAFLSMSHTNSFAENMTSGRGFIALAIVIFGRWNAWGALGAALLFGLAEGAQFFLQGEIATQFYPLLLSLPYVLTLVVLSSRKSSLSSNRAPGALGVPYEKS